MTAWRTVDEVMRDLAIAAGGPVEPIPASHVLIGDGPPPNHPEEDGMLLMYLQSFNILLFFIMKPTWMYGIQLWGISANSNLEILQRFQSKLLIIMTDSPCYITNKRLHHNLKIPTIKEEFTNRMPKYIDCISKHTNELAVELSKPRLSGSRLKRQTPFNLYQLY